MQSSRLIGQMVTKQCARRYGGGHNVVQSTYNDLPSPSGSWKTQFDSNQRKYNAHLAIGLAAFGGTLLVGKIGGMFEFYNDIPEHPAKIDSYK